MNTDFLRLVLQILTIIPPYAFTVLRQRISAFFHKRSYKSVPESEIKNVVVIGGSFGGHQAVKRLSETLPTGYRVVLVEKNSHLNYVFAFPRFSVIKGYEQYAFIPYSGLGKGAPEGIFSHVQDTVVEVAEKHVRLNSGEKLPYGYLVMATGTSSKLPSKVASTDSRDGQIELRGMQDKIADAVRIAVVGGGAVGVELVSDIKDFYPETDVALIHSRDQLLPSFGKKLHEHTLKRMEEMGVAVLLNERPKIPEEGGNLTLLNGKVEHFDLIIPCLGQSPNSSILASLSPSSISKATSHIAVKPTLQLTDSSFPYIFALGDVAATGGPKMGRAAYFQSEIVVQNILSMISGNNNLKSYKPNIEFEGSIKLTLGEKHLVMYTKQESGRELLVPLNLGHKDMDAERQWWAFGASADLKAMKNAASSKTMDSADSLKEDDKADKIEV